MDSSENIIIAKKVSKTFLSQQVLKNVSFNIKAGTFYALLGENGAGKSTLLRVMMGVETPDRGECLAFHQPVIGAGPQLKNKIGLVSESVEFDVPLNMRPFMKIYGELFESWDQNLFDQLVHDRKLNLDKKFKDYSRGQKMQLALIAALSIRPQILLIDEITSVLDIYARKYFINYIHEFVKNGGTVVLTTNIISEISFYATHLLLINKGEIQLDSSVKDIPQNFIKLRKNSDFNHPIFNDPFCYWAGPNSDESTSYIIPIKLKEKYQIPESLIDGRKVQLEDVFIYYFNNRTEIKNDKAA